LVALSVLGTIWADGPWSERWQGVGPTAKLLALPFFIYHFKRSGRANGCILLSCFRVRYCSSTVIFIAPDWRFTKAHGFDTAGIPGKNAIDQNQEFVLCFFGLLAASIIEWRNGKRLASAALATLAIAFLANVMFLALARTSLFYLTIIAITFSFRHFERRTTVLTLMGLVLVMPILWIGSPYLRGRIQHVVTEYREYRETNRPTSTGQRLEYWSQSINWIREAPFIGHGTGSARQLFNAAATGKAGAWADKIGNPHNQTLYVAIQWGALGCLILFAMWFVHFRMFFGVASFSGWVGAVVVIQNVASSLFNSHLFDFAEGWLYVLGVGVAGGAVSSRTAIIKGPAASVESQPAPRLLNEESAKLAR
jgi:O-antigen ligase